MKEQKPKQQQAQKSYICKECKSEFKHNSSHSRHQKTCGKDKTLCCARCEKAFQRKDASKRHLVECKPKPNAFECNKCRKSFKKNLMKAPHFEIR